MKLKYILILWFTVGHLWAVGEAGAIFLLIAPGAGPQGSGEAQVAKADDAYASYYNPGGLGFLKGTEVAGMHVNWLPNLASDLYYEFITYRHYIDGLGSLGGHIIFLNLGEQFGRDEFGNETQNWKSYMAAVAGSFGTKLSETSSIGFNFKIFHQKLSDHVTAGEEGKGYSTDFGFDVGYLKKFMQSSTTYRLKKKKKLNRLFDKLANIYNRQYELNDQILSITEKEENREKIIEEQTYLREELEGIRAKLLRYDTMENYSQLNERIVLAISDMDGLIDSFIDLQDQDLIPDSLEKFEDSKSVAMDRILFQLLEIESIRENINEEVETMEVKNVDDKFNFGLSISNIGPKIDFVDVDQADPSPTNMRIGIFAQLYNDGYNKINFLFDANKLLVTRYQMMDWDGDGFVGGYDEFGNQLVYLEDPAGDYNKDGKKEYDSKKYFDDPWYLAIFTAWLDDWYFGGDIDYDDERKIGGYIWEEDLNENGKPEVNELVEDKNGIYNGGDVNGKVEIEKGSGDNRSFKQELEETIYNMGLEYWYTNNFALRAGYIYDFEGKIFNPTFGAGIRLLQYGFDFGYTAGEQGHPRANTMFFSVNIKI